jgi:hypothetical protein
MKLAYLAQGNLYLKKGALAAQSIESEFGQDYINRATSRYQRDEWKGQGSQDGFNQWFGSRTQDPNQVRVNMTAVTNGSEADTMMDALAMAEIGGLFLYAGNEGVERRLVHKKEFHLRDLDRNLQTDAVACAHHLPSGVANIGIMRGYNILHITEGDSIDEAPSWVSGSEHELVFQSAGVARSANGTPMGIGPSAVQKLNVDKGDLTTLLQDYAFDYLQPHMTAVGDLYAIRRPYETGGRRPNSILTILGDILLFPFRVLRAIFHYLNFMSMMYSRQPLTRAGGPPQMELNEEDQKTLFLRGRRINAEKALRENRSKNELPALVPASWQLLKIDANGAETVLAKHVVAFDVDGDGNIVYTNGSGIYKVTGAGQKELITKDKLINNVCILR